MTNFNNERTHFFIKISLSHFIFERVDVSVCVRDELEMGTDCYIPPSPSSTIAEFLPHLGWVAQPWVTEGRMPSVCKLILTLASYLQLNKTVCALVILLFKVHLLPLFFRLFSLVHFLIDGSVEGRYITQTGVRFSSRPRILKIMVLVKILV